VKSGIPVFNNYFNGYLKQVEIKIMTTLKLGILNAINQMDEKTNKLPYQYGETHKS